MFETIKEKYQLIFQQEKLDLNEAAFADPFRLFPKAQFTPYNPDSLVKIKGLKIYDKIRRDEQAKIALAFKKHAVVSTGWSIQTPEELAEEEYEPSLFIETQLQELKGTFEQSIIQMLSCFDYGYSITEKIYKLIEQGDYTGRIGLKALKTKKPHSFNFRQNEYGDIEDIIQAQTKGNVPLPVQKFIIYTYRNEFQNPYGISDLREAYRAWWHKNNAYKWLGMLLERFGIPPLFIFYDPGKYNTSTLDELKTILKNLQAATFGLIPRAGGDDTMEGWTPSQQYGRNTGQVFVPALDRFDQDIARAILMPNLLGMTPDKISGSFARSKTTFDVFMLILEMERTNSEELINEEIIRPLVRLNWDTEDYPVFKWNPLTENKKDEILKTWSELVSKKVVQTTDDDEAHVREMMEFPPRDYEEEPEEDDSQPEPEPDPDPDDEDTNPQFMSKRYKERSKFERRVNFRMIEQLFNLNERMITAELKSQLINSRDALIKKVQRKDLNMKLLQEIKSLSTTAKFKKILTEYLLMIFEGGRNELANELRKVNFKKVQMSSHQKKQLLQYQTDNTPNFIPTAAIRLLRNKALQLASTTEGSILKDVKRALTTAIELGETGRQASSRLREVFEPYIGDTTKIRGDSQLQPHRLENIVRTETTYAFNRGRLVESRRKDIQEFMRGMQYSAILDSRTTPVCQHLDGKIFEINDPELDTLTPPNHFQCRSLLVPVTIADEINESEIISPSEAGKGKELANKGFV